MKKSLLLMIMGLPLWAGVVLNAVNPPKIVVAEDAVPSVKFAASELAYFVGKAFGKEVEQAAKADGGVRIIVGVGPDGKRETSVTYDSHIIVRNDGTIYIYGYDTDEGSVKELRTIMNVRNKGTLEAAYTFLEECIGVRWLEPGKAGEYVPRHETLELPEMERTLSPSYRERRLFYLYMLQWFNKKNRPPDYEDYGDGDDFQRWIIRLRYTGSKTRVNGCHTPSIMDFEKNLYPQHPELFALQADGTRSGKDMCWSSQATKDFWWEVVDAYFQLKPLPYSLRLPWKPWESDEFMIDPHDYGKNYFCTCPTCSAFIKKYGDNGFGECVFQTIAEVARKVEAKYPDKFITTLVYPPKKMYPESVELPKNLRVRMTVSDNAICSDQTFADKEIQLMRRWREQQGNKLRLWMYILFDFGGRLHGVPEFASTNFVNFLKKAAPYADGVFYEHIEPNHTMRNVDIYLIYHSLWDINYDIDKGRKEFFKLAYGAADDMLAFYNRVERNSDTVMKTMIAHPEERPHAVAHKLRKRVFNTIYTFDELEALQKMLDDAKAKVPRGSIEAKRIMRYEKHVLEPARKEFILYSDDKEHAFRQQLPLYCLRTDEAPTEKEWDAAPWIEMATASPDAPANVKSLVKLISARDAFHVRARFDEPQISKSRTVDEGNKISNIWDDNETELFFASENKDIVIQVGINDKGVAVIHYVDDHTFRMAGDEVKAVVKREDGAWTLTAAFSNSLTGFSQKASYDKFNMIRARNVSDLPSEYHTLNPECILGRWNIPAFYSMVKYIERNPLEMKYKGRGMPVSDVKTTVLVEDAVASIDKWSDWVTPPGKATFGRDEKVRHGSAPSRVIDRTMQEVTQEELSASMRFEWPIPPKGTRIRVTAWVLVQSSYPDAAIGLSTNWLNAEHRWFTKEDLGGGVTMPVTHNEWQKLAVEIIVPDVEELKYVSPSIGGARTAASKVWIGEVKLETVAP